MNKANILQRQFCNVFTKEPGGELLMFKARTNAEIGDIVMINQIVKKKILNLKKTKVMVLMKSSRLC